MLTVKHIHQATEYLYEAMSAKAEGRGNHRDDHEKVEFTDALCSEHTLIDGLVYGMNGEGRTVAKYDLAGSPPVTNTVLTSGPSGVTAHRVERP
mgnify:CR=1 FL=1